MNLVNKVLVEYLNIEGTEIYLPDGAEDFSEKELEVLCEIAKQEVVFAIKEEDMVVIWYTLESFLNDYDDYCEQIRILTIDGLKELLIARIDKDTLTKRAYDTYAKAINEAQDIDALRGLVKEIEDADYHSTTTKIEKINEMFVVR